MPKQKRATDSWPAVISPEQAKDTGAYRAAKEQAAKATAAESTSAEPLSEAWYEKEIRDRLAFIPWLHNAGESKAARSAAGELGSLVLRAAFGWGSALGGLRVTNEDLKLGRAHRKGARKGTESSAKSRRDKTTATDASLRAEEAAIRERRPGVTDRALARMLAHRGFGKPGTIRDRMRRLKRR